MESRRVIHLWIRRKNLENDKVFIDLEGYSEADDDNVRFRVKTVEMRQFADLKAIADLADQDGIIIVEASLFEEGQDLRKDAMDKMRSIAEDRGGSFSQASDRVAVITPAGIGIDKCRIRRKK